MSLYKTNQFLNDIQSIFSLQFIAIQWPSVIIPVYIYAEIYVVKSNIQLIGFDLKKKKGILQHTLYLATTPSEN